MEIQISDYGDPWIDFWISFFNHVYQISHNKKNSNTWNIFLSHLQNFFFEWTYGILARESGWLHVQSVEDKRCEYKYEVIVILEIPATTSKQTI